MEAENIGSLISSNQTQAAVKLFDSEIKKGAAPWEIHESLFETVQPVLNPPFINPHLPKMYAICREFVPFLKPQDLPGLVRLEIAEYASRPRLAELPKADIPRRPIDFNGVEEAIAAGKRGETAKCMAAFLNRHGGEEFARRMLLLGSGYLNNSLGHSISCTAFILLEMLKKKNRDPWPVLSALAEYFCRGHFETTPTSDNKSPLSAGQMEHHILRATSGQGIINLHHTITIYSIDRVRHLFRGEEQSMLISAWIDFMGDKEPAEVMMDESGPESFTDYDHFYSLFSELNPKPLLKPLVEATRTPDRIPAIKRYLARGVCDLYQGTYNPHYLTGLGSLFWLLDTCRDSDAIILNGLFQYLDFFFNGLKSDD